MDSLDLHYWIYITGITDSYDLNFNESILGVISLGAISKPLAFTVSGTECVVFYGKATRVGKLYESGAYIVAGDRTNVVSDFFGI